MPVSTLSSARVTAGQQDAFSLPRLSSNYRNPAIYCHGVGAAASEAMGGTALASSARVIVDAVADAGFPVGAPTAPATWGNATGRTRTSAMATYLRNTVLAGSGKLVLLGISHGTTWAFDYAIANPNDVACIVAILPIPDLTTVRDANIEGLRSSIDTAWGVAYPTALPAGADPALNTAALSAIPMQLWYSSDDDLSINTDLFVAATGAESVNLGALGHTDAAIAAVDRDVVVAFVREHTLN